MSREEERIKKILEVAEDPAGVLFDHIEEVDSKFEEIETKVEEVKTLVKDAVDNRINGKDGESIKGDKGDKGEKGDPGPKGDKGDNGKDGQDGLNGLDGKDGVDGKDGLDGEQGPKGDKGDTGKTPLHEWFGSSLRFELPDGKWGPWANLQGPAGQNRASSVARELIIKSGGSVVANDAQMIDFVGATVTRQGQGVLVTIPTTSPGGTSGSVQYNNGGVFGGFGSYDSGTGVLTLSGNLNLGTNILIGHSLRSDASDGVLIEAANGTDVGIFGAGNTANSLFYGSVNINGNLTVNTLSGVLKATAGLVSGSATTSDLPEGTNLYYTDARARASISVAGAPLSYVAGTGVITFDTATTTLTKYVLKTGDTMTGTLNLFPSSDVAPAVIKAGGTSTAIKSLDIQDNSATSWWYVRKGLLSDANIGMNVSFSSSGSTATSRTGLNMSLAAGYTGAEFTGVLGFDSSIAGTATYYTADATVYGYRASGNRGIGGFSRAVTTGHNVGGMFLAGGGAVNYGVWAASTITKSSGTNVGVLAVAANASATSPGAIGLYATLYNSSTVPPNMTGIKTALLVDNQAFTDPIAIFRSNGVAFVSVEDAGQLLLGNRASTTSLGKLFNIPVDVATTDATLTVAESYTTATDTMYFIQSIITCQSSDRTKGGNIKIEGTFKNVAGTVTQIGVTTVVNNTVTDAGITSVFAVSGTAVQVKVTGLAATNIRFQNCFIINRVKY